MTLRRFVTPDLGQDITFVGLDSFEVDEVNAKSRGLLAFTGALAESASAFRQEKTLTVNTPLGHHQPSLISLPITEEITGQ